MNKDKIAERIQEARDRLPDESKAAAILDALLADMAEQKAIAMGGGNGNGPPTGP